MISFLAYVFVGLIIGLPIGLVVGLVVVALLRYLDRLDAADDAQGENSITGIVPQAPLGFCESVTSDEPDEWYWFEC